MDTPTRSFRFDRWWGLAAGIAFAIGDTLFAHWAGFRFQINGRDATFLTGCYFGSSFAMLGFGLGWLVEARRHERAQAAIIRAQVGEITATRQRLAQQEKLAALGQLATAIAHEVRNPLAVIRSAAQGLAETERPDGAAIRHATDFIIAEIDRLTSVVNALLAFARPPKVAAGTSPSTTCSTARSSSPATISTPRGSASRAGETGRVPALAVDADLLCQVLLGLLANAVEAVPAGGEVGLDGARRRRAHGRDRRRRQRARGPARRARARLRALLHHAAARHRPRARRRAPDRRGPRRRRSPWATAPAAARASRSGSRPGGARRRRHEAARAGRRRRGAHGGRRRRGARARRLGVRSVRRRRGRARGTRRARRRRRRHRLEDAGHGRPRAAPPPPRAAPRAARDPAHRARRACRRRSRRCARAPSTTSPSRSTTTSSAPASARALELDRLERENRWLRAGGREPLRARGDGRRERAEPGAARARPPRRARARRRCWCRARAAPARSWWRASSTTGATASASPSSPSTARRSPRASSRASSSATRRARSPAPPRRAPAASSARKGGTLFLDEIGEVEPGLPGEAPARAAGGRGAAASAAASRGRSTCASSPRPTACCATRWRPAASARTSSSA